MTRILAISLLSGICFLALQRAADGNDSPVAMDRPDIRVLKDGNDSPPADRSRPLPGSEQKAQEKRARWDLGPFFSYRAEDATREYLLRPLFRWKRGPGYRELEFLYPLGKYRRIEAPGDPDQAPFQLRLLPILATEHRPESGAEGKWDYFFLFPYYSARSQEGEERWGIFPLYGRMEDWFGREEIRFYLWPVYFWYTEEGSLTRHLLFPLFSWTRGPGERGIKLWPFYGKKEKAGEFSRRFILWPFHFSVQDDLSSDSPRRLFAILPFYLRQEAQGTRTTGILYPFFTSTKNEETGFRSWAAPWPFVQKVEGEGIEKFWIFPLWGQTRREAWDSRFILWPLYTHDRLRIEEEGVEREVHRFLLINRSERVTWKREGREGRYLHLWPLFTYQRDKEARVRLSILSLLPFEDEGFERHYAPLFRLYGYTRDAAGHFDSELLWGLYRREKSPQEERIALGPLASWKRKTGPEGTELTILQGLLDYRSQPGQRSLRLFYLPWRVDW